MKPILFGVVLTASFTCLAQANLERLGDPRLNFCSEELKESGDHKAFVKNLKKDLQARDSQDIYLSSTIKPFIRESGLDLESFEISGLMSPEKARKALGKNTPRSYDMQLKGDKVLVWPALWKGSQRLRLSLEPTLVVPASKIDPAILTAMQNKTDSLEVAKNKDAKSGVHATRNSQGVYEFLYGSDGKLDDMGGLEEFFIGTLDGLCDKRAQRSEWARDRNKVNEKPAPHNK